MPFIKAFALVTVAITVVAAMHTVTVAERQRAVGAAPTASAIVPRAMAMLARDTAAVVAPPPSPATVTLWGKVVATTILGLAALFVVLSRRYDAATQKWAVSVLTLIAGVWIGSAV